MMCLIGNFLSTIVKISSGPGALLLESFLITLRDAFQRGVRPSSYIGRLLNFQFHDRCGRVYSVLCHKFFRSFQQDFLLCLPLCSKGIVSIS